MDNIGLAKRLIDPPDGDWQPLLDHLAEDVVFNVTIPGDTPISGEFRGRRAVTEHFARLGYLLEFRQERPMEFLGSGDHVVVLGRESFLIKKNRATVSGREYADVLDFRDGLITASSSSKTCRPWWTPTGAHSHRCTTPSGRTCRDGSGPL